MCCLRKTEVFMKKACVTGHRNINNTQINCKAVNKLIDLAINNGIEQFLVGMSRGADFRFAEVLSERKLNWVAVIPCLEQTILWTTEDRNHHLHLLKFPSDMIILTDFYKQGVMQARNKYMVDNSELLLAIYDDSEKGGTAHTVKSAIEQNKLIYQFNPKNREFKTIYPSQLTLF